MITSTSLAATPIAGDDAEAAVTVLFDAHCDFVCRTLRRLGIEEAGLDDAVQDVFVTAFRRWSSFEGRSSPRTWLFGIARRVASRQRRRAQTRGARIVADAAPEIAVDPHGRNEAAHSLAALLSTLDRDKRAVFVLRELEGMTAPEISEALGIPLGTAYSRLRAAWAMLGREAEHEQRRLRAHLHRLAPPPEPAPRRRRMWAMVTTSIASATALPIAAPATGWLASTATKWLVVGAALGLGYGGARLATAPSVAPSVPTTTPTTIPRATASVGPTHAASAEPIPAAPSVAPSLAPSLAPPATPTSPVPAPTRARPPAAPPTTPTGDLAAELQLIEQARRALRDGDPNTALARLDEHRRRFASGQLAAERQAQRVEALCAAGRTSAAREVARANGNARDDVCTN